MQTNFFLALVVVVSVSPTKASGQGRWLKNQLTLHKASPNKIQRWHYKGQLLSSMKANRRVYNDTHATPGQKRRALHNMRAVYFGAIVNSARFKTDGMGRVHPNFNSSGILTSTMRDLKQVKTLQRQAGIPLKVLTTRQPVDTNRTAAKAQSVRKALGFINGLLVDTMHKRKEALRVDAARAAKGLKPKPNKIVVRASESQARAMARNPAPDSPTW